MWSPNDKRWLLFFIPFLLLVAGTMLLLHLFGQPVMEDGESKDLQFDRVILTSSTPDWVEEEALPLVRQRLPEAYAVPETVEHRDADSVCEGTFEGDRYEYPCEPGAITYMVWDQKMASCSDDDCPAAMFFLNNINSNPSCTIMVPPDIEMALPIEASLTGDGRAVLPPDAGALAVAQEHIHCKRGSAAHIYTPIFGPVYSLPTGHVMHPSILHAGWGVEGL